MFEQAHRDTSPSDMCELDIYVSGSAKEVCQGCIPVGRELSQQRPNMTIRVFIEQSARVFQFQNGNLRTYSAQ